MPKVGDSIAGKYKIDQLIGVGGMGAVFSATHLFTGKRVAMKWMLPELAQDHDAVQRFMREAHAAGRINHPNVVDIYDVGQHDNSYFLVMEYLQGEPLTSALARRDLTPSEVLTLLLPAMRGVAAAHRQLVVHRDLKPDNIFLAYEEDGVRREAKVLDFGISKVSNDGQVDLRLTRTGAVVGTPYYMSPEQIRGSSGLDKRADVYAFGVILYEALCGQVPFQADTYGALVLEIATGTPKSLDVLVPGLPSELSRVVLRAMARDVSQRYASMESLIAALEPFLGSGNNSRSDHRNYVSHHGQSLEDTRITAAPLSQPATVPHLASTPFAAEASASSLGKRSPAYGIALFVGAAVAIVLGVWYATRDPEPTTADRLVLPQTGQDVREDRSAATAAPVATLPVATPPSLPAYPSVLPTVQPSAAAVAPAAAAPIEVTRTPATQESGNRSRPAARRHFAGTHSVQSGEREPRESGQQAVPAEAPEQPAQHRARSGTLNVNEF
jgi:eukaryotic-like serine/threonine-protein kinase